MGQACIKGDYPYGKNNGGEGEEYTLPMKKKKKTGYLEIVLTPILTPEVESGLESRAEPVEKDRNEMVIQNISTSSRYELI